MKEPGSTKLVSSAATVLLLVVAAAIAWPFRNGLLWGLVFSGITYPLFRRLRLRFKPGVSSATTVLATLFGCAVPVALICWFVAVQIRQFAVGGGFSDSGLDGILAQLQSVADPYLHRAGIDLDLSETWQTNKEDWTASLSTVGIRSLRSLGQIALDLGIGIFTQFFILRDVDLWRKWGRTKRGIGEAAFDRVSYVGYRTVQAVFKGVVVVAGIQGIVIGIAYLIAGMPNWPTLAVLSGLLCVVPFLGAPVIYVPVAIVLFTQGKVWQGVLVLAVGFGIVSQIDNLLRPFFISGETGLHPLVIFVSLLGGVLLLGPVGLMVGPVLLAVLNEMWTPTHSRETGIAPA